MYRKVFMLILTLLVMLTGCAVSSIAPPKLEPPAAKPRETSITITAMGDFLMHLPVIYSAKNPATGHYEFSSLFDRRILDWIAGADYSIANLETRLAGDHMGISGYPVFNCPTDLATEMKNCGLDMFLTANNHSLDMKAQGVFATNNTLDAAGLDRVGTYNNAGEKARPFVKDIKGVRVGIMNYTESTNGFPIPADKPYLVNVIDRPAMLREIKQLREAGADLIIACIHFGVEYSRQPSKEQVDLAEFLFDAGVEVVLGNHVHVVQPAQVRMVEEGGAQKKKFVAYSLGNFISNQRWRYSDSGLMINLTVTKNLDTGVTELGEIKLIPVWVHTCNNNGRLAYRVLPVREAIADYNNKTDHLLTEADYQRLLQVAEEIGEIGAGF